MAPGFCVSTPARASICALRCAAASATRSWRRSSEPRGRAAPTAEPKSDWAWLIAARCTGSSRCAPIPSGRSNGAAGDLILMMNKITVVGAGNVGATAAQRLAEKELARRVILVDVIEGVPQGKGLDQWKSAPIEGFDTRVLGANDYAPAAGSELVVVTAGIARKPGMSRDELVRTNADIVKQVSLEIKRHCPDAIVLVVSNPLDVMCWVTKQVTGFPRERVIGMAAGLDTGPQRAVPSGALPRSGGHSPPAVLV